ncbi:RNA 2',3'-cyclic phosphodiesterase [Paenibacillus macquariensis]|uniref:RNA 2',3'-cyclic phosphodiesterase n=1 Tax=Paenibacillus macquariensis TaxID=948756 RepID=A0ABY1JQT1_9BACL|nr:RNA 2',3'-cyclic phosphodiesterase [Paenibacillus macquariensis]MEC0092629.1 RNA 2',3'-cyclic phosphodiesterase [Paenibacillus macquariensis]OAB36570.1 hypothetical protein PMSM_06085 [Paenibacillus macquariensis subsp. macquariensis]SIQ62578.1 2'-5' RNA ligase [Paenibacillus macquariensis]
MRTHPTNTGSQRLFVAVRVSDELRWMLEEQCSDWKEHLPFRKWTFPEDYHITLQFLGDVESEKIPDLCESLRHSASQASPFTLGVGYWSTFGLAESPRVLWASVTGSLERLGRLQQAVTESTELLGFHKETREYRPHITLARKYEGESTFQGQALLSSIPSLESLPWYISEFVLFSTKMGSQPMYEVVDKFSL